MADRCPNRLGNLTMAPAIDVRAALDGKVWPSDPHDFVGDELDILDEQVAQVGIDGRVTAAKALLELVHDPDRIIRSLAVGALASVHDGLETKDLVVAEQEAGALLDETAVTRNRMSGRTIRDELHLRIAESKSW